MSNYFRAGAPNVLAFSDIHDASLRQNSGGASRGYLNTGAGLLTFYHENGAPVTDAVDVPVTRVAAVPGKWEARVGADAAFVAGERVQYRGSITGDVEGGEAGVTVPLEGWLTVTGATSRYDVTGHGLLGDRARALPPDELAAQAKLAETMLGLDTVDVTDDVEKSARARMAVALQVNLALASPAEAMALTSSSRGGRSQSYKDGIPLVHPTAATIVRQLTGTPEFRRLTSKRDGGPVGDDRHERLRGTSPGGPSYPWG